MQRHCLGQAREGTEEIDRLRARPEFEKSDALARALAACMVRWTDAYGIDWHMSAYCFRKEVEAYTELTRP